MKKTVLITGSSGYIGTNLIYFLRKKFNIQKIDKKINFDINDINFFDWKDIPDVIIHLAALSSISECKNNKIQCINDNILATSKLICFAKTYNIPIVFASSGAVENYNQSFYGLSKKINELELSSIPSISLRFSNVYGGINYFEEKTSVIAKFIQQMKHNKPLIINGDGSQTRDFIHVNDICKAISLSIEKILNNNFTESKIIEIGTGKETSILELSQLFNWPYEFNKESENIGVKSSKANIQIGNEFLGFQADTNLNINIKELVNYIKKGE